jgi:TOMM system kinase/cyclase fusion protein
MASAVELLHERYRVLQALGVGSGGEVWKAVQVSTGQSVAIKVLSVQDLEPNVQARRLERFRREIMICSRFYHPDIVRLIDYGELDACTHFAAFEYVPGTTLAELLEEQGMLTVQRARSLMIQLLPALAYAHAKGIAHRDLKPGNIMVTSDGMRDRVKILDFGISVATGQYDSDLARLTLSNEWVGTPTYAAPEQHRGEAVGPKSDLYAWGLIFVECMTGTPVLDGKSLGEIIEQQLRPLVLPAAIQRHRLGALLARVLEREPARRPDDANLLQSFLERIPTEDLEDANGYLRDVQKGSTHSRPPLALSGTLTDGPGPSEGSERRHATVLVCRIALTPSSARRGADELDSQLEDGNALVCETLGQFGAAPSHSLGGHTLAYFGLLHARDSDARMALRASLEIVNRLERMGAGEGRAMIAQIGIHHGPVTIQSSQGVRRPLESSTAWLAVRLACVGDDRGEVPSDGSRILISDDFRQLVLRHAEVLPYESEARIRVPWRDAPVTPFLVLGESRASANHAERSAFVGRGAELEALESAWAERSAKATPVLVVGEAGIGKSRLIVEMMKRLESKGVEWLEARCLPEWQNAFLRPLSTLIIQRFGLTGLGGPRAAVRVQQRIRELGLDGEIAVPLFCSWLSFPLPDGYAPPAWSPQKHRQLLHRHLAEVVLACSGPGGALLVEDLHWADPSTLEWLDVLVRHAHDRGAFVVMTARPEFGYAWSLRPRELRLSGLDADSVAQMSTNLLPETGPDGAITSHIVERSDGVPLYVEELARALRPHVASVQATIPSASVTTAHTQVVPESLRALLTSRLDAIGEARQTAQFAAALGREFSLERLIALSDREEFALLGDLEQLTSAEILIKRLRMRSPVFVFRHALIRDAAYDSMAPAGRRRVHERIATGMELHLADLVEAQPDVLAHHWEQAGNAQRATLFWQRASTKSILGSAHSEALLQLERALANCARLSESDEAVRREAELLLARGATMVATRGYADPEAQRSFERAAARLPRNEQTRELVFAARWGSWYFHNARAELGQAWELANELAALAREARDSSLAVSAWEAICETNYCIGHFEEAVCAGERCERDYDFDRHRHLAAIRGDDPLLASVSFMALAELFRGRPAESLRRVQQGLTLSDRLGYPAMQAAMHAQAAWTYFVWGSSGAARPNLARAREHASIAVQMSKEHGFAFWESYGRMTAAAARIVTGDVDAAGDLRQGLEMWRAGGATIGTCWPLAYLAEAARRDGRHGAARELLDEALELCRAHDTHFFEPEVRALRAELHLDGRHPRRDLAAAAEELREAAQVAERYGARWWTLAVSVRRIRLQVRAFREDRAELEAVLARFGRSDDDPPLLREAHALASVTEGASPAMLA